MYTHISMQFLQYKHKLMYLVLQFLTTVILSFTKLLKSDLFADWMETINGEGNIGRLTSKLLLNNRFLLLFRFSARIRRQHRLFQSVSLNRPYRDFQEESFPCWFVKQRIYRDHFFPHSQYMAYTIISIFADPAVKWQNV